ncbi:MAG: (Fe-S)-binding protein [Dehalococcoidia bacterium]
MFRENLCDLCGECLVRCQWIEADRQQAAAWMKDMIEGRQTPVLRKCITCYACNEFCPQDANPFDLIARLQERYQVFFDRKVITQEEAKYIFNGQLRNAQQEERVMSTCVFEKTDAHLMEGELYQLPRVGGKPYYCWILFSHMGAESVQRKHARELVDRLAMSGAREIVFFHDDCYAMVSRMAPEYGIEVPFRPVHFSEYLVEYLSARRDRIRPLGLKIAYQRPCASRHTPYKEHFIDEFFGLVGVDRVQRQFDRENALCCAGITLMLGNADPGPAQEKNIIDARQSGAQAMVCLCPMCSNNLAWTAGKYQMPLIFLGDLARMALGELDPPVNA